MLEKQDQSLQIGIETKEEVTGLRKDTGKYLDDECELPRASRAGLPASWPTLAPQRCDVEVLTPQAQRAVPSPRGGYLPQHCNLYRQQ